MIGTSKRVLPGGGWGGGGGVVKMPNFNPFLHLSEHHKFEYFSQPLWYMQFCEEVKFMER